MSTHLRALLLLSLIAAVAYCQVAPVPYSPSSSSSSSSAAAARRADRRNYEQHLLEHFKQRIIQQLGINVTEDGALVRGNGTSARRPAAASTKIVNPNVPINISIDGKRGAFRFHCDVVNFSFPML